MLNNNLRLLEDVDLKYNDKGLIPTVVQDIDTKDVLMVAYMNEESLQKTLESGETTFYSRSRQELWHKGETSGNTQKVEEIYYDCDKDTLLVLVEPAGPACHTGNTSCFYRKLAESKDKKERYDKDEIINMLYNLIKSRKNELPEDSYTTYLFEEGIDKILKKIGEESSEVIIAAKNEPKNELVYETADLIYHLMVLLVEKEVNLDQIRNELSDRYKS
ncbi:MAG TPA: bifunctional phosphoribosyl-AMP cyclohydrolase/phosphoribosyl-ATP diphosphatase HisIE [Halanaerobiales bacterium]|nr:bifunctional phosphoribosyl-AMP cyclohydrolase/phosphoribosyl-ATP diphosphatase HisIE [Halanaerobiales bacterium]